VLARQSAVPVELPVDVARVVRFLARASELASQVGAFLEARSHLQSAIALAPESERGRLYEALGDNVHQVLRGTGAAAYREALARWRAEPAGDALRGTATTQALGRLPALGRNANGWDEWRELEECRRRRVGWPRRR
jgi:hypothetical protein